MIPNGEEQVRLRPFESETETEIAHLDSIVFCARIGTSLSLCLKADAVEAAVNFRNPKDLFSALGDFAAF